MNLRTLFATIIALGVGTAAVAEQPKTVHYQLRNVAAADAAQALTRFAEQKSLSIRVIPEPVSNTLILLAEPAQLKQATAVLSALDVQPPCVQVQMLLVRVPAQFAEDLGLGKDTKRVLTPREMKRLQSAIRQQKSEGHVEVLSRPEVLTRDNQAATVQIGNDQSGITASLTPRITTAGAILLRVQVQLNQTTTGQWTNTQLVVTTDKVRDGGTLLVRGPYSKDEAGASEILTVLTPRLVKPN